MLAILNSLVISGIEAKPVRVEVDIQNGLPCFEVVGLASTAIKEARDRVRAAIKNCGFQFPNRRITVNLAPADFKKEGSHFDLPIALGIIIASGQLDYKLGQEHYFAGEVSLNGDIGAVPGVLPMALDLANISSEARFVIPLENTLEASLVPEVHSLPFATMNDVCAYVSGELIFDAFPEYQLGNEPDYINVPDFSEVKGQVLAKRALVISAAGMHNILLIGPPGGGKTMLARRLPSILPQMSREEMMETTKIYSVANLLNAKHPLIDYRPFRTPHKNASSASIIGGGRIPRPGEISLSQNGVLFLDELPEFSRDVLEALRQPLEDRVVTVARAQATYTYPANFCLVGSMNPCMCGNFGSDLECRCTPTQIQRYLGRISGPLLDRMDLHVEVPRVKLEQLQERSQGESSDVLREKVEKARAVQKARFARLKINLNSEMRPSDVKKFCQLDDRGNSLLKNAFDRLNMTARSYDRVLKISRTIADLEQSENIRPEHLAEALQYRSLDRKYWNRM